MGLTLKRCGVYLAYKLDDIANDSSVSQSTNCRDDIENDPSVSQSISC